MGNDEGMQPPHRHYDICNARGTQQPVSRQQHDIQVGQPAQDWQELMELLNKVKDNLMKEKEAEPWCRILPTGEKAIQHVNALQRRYGEHTTQSNGTKTQLNWIEAGINEIRWETWKGTPSSLGATPTQGRLWAAVTTQAAHTVKVVTMPERITVCVRLEESQGRELLWMQLASLLYRRVCPIVCVTTFLLLTHQYTVHNLLIPPQPPSFFL